MDYWTAREQALKAAALFEHWSNQYNAFKERYTRAYLDEGKAPSDAEFSASKCSKVDDAAKKAIWFRQKSIMYSGLAAMLKE